MAAPAVTNSGVTCSTVLTVASGAWRSERTMKTVAAAAAASRAAIIGVASTARGRTAPKAIVQATSMAVAMVPLTTMISPEASSAVSSLTMASFTTKAADPVRIARMPLRLSVTRAPPLPTGARAGRCRAPPR